MRVACVVLFACTVLCVPGYTDPQDTISLAGAWAFRLDPDGQGVEQQWQSAAFTETVRLPGSLDENAMGTPNAEASPSFLSRKFSYTGPAWYQRDVEIPEAWAGKALEIYLERCHWETQLWIDGRFVGVQDSLCAPHVYTTGSLAPGPHRLTLRIDNSVKYDVGSRAHSITEHTQTNWNGIVGRMEVRPLSAVRIASIDVYPDASARTATADVRVINTLERAVRCEVTASALGTERQTTISVPAGNEAITKLVLDLGESAPLWDEFSPRLIDLDVAVRAPGASAIATESKRVRFGLRTFDRSGTQFTLNGRPYFVRGNLECCIFPLTGYPVADVDSWRRMMETMRQYGLNHIRFHSWCPPEAAFIAADEAGITLHVETPVWTDLGKDPQLDRFIHDEAKRILRAYGNHPSFVMLAVGNEPSGPNKDAFLNDIVSQWQAQDPRRLYTTCAGWPELPVSDYHVVHERGDKPYRLHRGPLSPSTNFDYSDVLAGASAPAIAHELGQWCVYPDYREISNYTGTLEPRNLEGFRERLRINGMLDQAHEFALASGKLQMLMYKADIEALLRTPGAGGFQLLSLQDFPGQGSALVGFLDALWQPKPGVSASAFRSFCSETVPLLRMDKRVWTNDETLTAQAEIAHYGPAPIANANPAWAARTGDGQIVATGQWDERDIPIGNGIGIGEISIPLDAIAQPTKITLSVFLAGTSALNAWDVWVYPAHQPDSETHDRVLIAEDWTDDVTAALRRGRSVLLLPRHITPSRLVQSAFEPIFWNTQWFPGQDRQLGILCDARHAALAAFPIDGCTDWLWWDLLEKSRVLRLDGLDPAFRPIVQVIDDWNKNRRLGALFESRVGRGRLMVCMLDIGRDLDHRPAAAALRRSIIAYMDSSGFAPAHELPDAWLKQIFVPGSSRVAQVESDSAAAGHGPENAFDNDPTTCWHTVWETNPPEYPHELRMYLAEESTITGLRLLPRQDVPNGYIRQYAVHIAKDGRNWGVPVATGELSPGADWKTIQFDQPVKTRWLRFVAVSSQSDEVFAALAELAPVFADEQSVEVGRQSS